MSVSDLELRLFQKFPILSGLYCAWCGMTTLHFYRHEQLTCNICGRSHL